MSRRATPNDWRLEKLKMRMQAAEARPESPRIKEQLGLEKSLVDLQKESTEGEKKLNNQMFDELSEGWKGNQSSGGDAFVTGLKSGLQQGSIMEDKKRYKKVMDVTEKMREMVASQNEEIFKQEKLFNARKSATPRIMAYLDSYQRMSANDRKVYLQNAMDEYNKVAGTSYKVVDATGSEPWKIFVSDDGYPSEIDLMDFIKTPEEKKYDYYLKSEEVKNYESDLQQEYDMDRRLADNKINQKNKGIFPEEIQDKKRSLVESGEIPEDAILFDEIPEKEKAAWMEDMRKERDKGRAAKSGIKALDEMGNIFKKYPNISTSLAKWASSTDDSLLGSSMKKIVNQDERNALIQLDKHAARLAIGTIEQFKGMRPTDILKKLIKETNPGSNFTYDAFIPIKNQYKEEFEEQVGRSDEAERGLLNRYVPTYRNVGKKSQTAEKPAQMSEKDKILQEIMQLEKEIENG